MATSIEKRAYLSYCWHDGTLITSAVNLGKALASKNIKAYVVRPSQFSERPSLLDEAAKDIDRADVFVLLFNKQYETCSNCKQEANYADKRQKHMLAVKMCKDPPAQGWLPFFLSDALWIDGYEKLSDEVAHEILRRIEIMFNDNPTGQSYKSEIEFCSINFLDVPKYVHRQALEAILLDALKKVCNEPKRGLLVVTGDKGMGKTALLSAVLRDGRNFSKFQKEFNIDYAILMRNRLDIDKFKQNILNSFKAATGKTFSSVDGLLEFCRNRLLVVLDADENNVDLVEFLSEQYPSIPLCLLTRDATCFTENERRFVRKPVVEIGKMTNQENGFLLDVLSNNVSRHFSEQKVEAIIELCKGIPSKTARIASVFAAIDAATESFDETFDIVMADETLQL